MLTDRETNINAAKALMSLGHPVFDCVAGYGTILDIKDAKIIYYRRRWWERLLGYAQTPFAIEMRYICGRDGEPCESVGRVYYDFKYNPIPVRIGQ